MTLFKSAPVAVCLAASALLFSATAGAQTPAPAAASAPATATPEIAAKQAAGQLAAAAWLTMLDQRNGGGAYEASSQTFRNMVQIGQWMDSIPGLRQPFGTYQSRSVDNVVYKTTLPGRPDGEYVTAIFQSEFANKKVEELVTTVREADGKWRVIGYSPR